MIAIIPSTEIPAGDHSPIRHLSGRQVRLLDPPNTLGLSQCGVPYSRLLPATITHYSSWRLSRVWSAMPQAVRFIGGGGAQTITCEPHLADPSEPLVTYPFDRLSQTLSAMQVRWPNSAIRLRPEDRPARPDQGRSRGPRRPVG